MKIFSSLFVLLIFISSCKTSTGNSSKKNISEIFSGSYDVSALNEENVLSRGITFSIDFSSKKVSGNSGCNTYSVSFELSENSHIDFSNLTGTKLYCVDKKKNEIEKKFVSVLNNTFTIVPKENGIELKGVNDNSKIVLAKK